jgi:hypothetical protein
MPAASIARDLVLIGNTYRQIRYLAGDKAAAEQAALDAYCSLHPDVPRAAAREAVSGLIKASSEAGLICTQNW